MTDWFLGTMGFSYKEWRGVFYPAGMPARQYLGHYSQRFNAVEMDSTFYGAPPPENVQRWTAVTPSTFRICPKVPRAITHDRRLLGVTEEMTHFLDTVVLLGDQLGPILIQLPPNFTTDSQDTFVDFLNTLPAEHRFAVEFRHDSWHKPETAVLLRRHNICWAAADYIHLPKKLHRTTDFLYLRFIGRHGQYAAKNREMEDKTEALEAWYGQIEPHLEEATAVYAFFNNDYAGYSPATCNRFRQIVGLPPADLRVMRQGRLF